MNHFISKEIDIKLLCIGDWGFSGVSSEKCILGGNHADRKKVPSGHCLYFHFSEADTDFLS